jgi:hypothetical protein
MTFAAITSVPIALVAAVALISFAFNVGGGAFADSTLLRKLNAGDYKAVPSELARWTKAGGRSLPGLERRRRAEGELFAKGDYDPAAGTRIATSPAKAAEAKNQPTSVLDVQTALKKIGWPLQPDGVAGKHTRQARRRLPAGLRLQGIEGRRRRRPRDVQGDPALARQRRTRLEELLLPRVRLQGQRLDLRRPRPDQGP